MTEAPYGSQHLLELALTLNLGVLEYAPHSTSECGGCYPKTFIQENPTEIASCLWVLSWKINKQQVGEQRIQTSISEPIKRN